MNKTILVFIAGGLTTLGTVQITSTPPAQCMVNAEVKSMADTLQKASLEQVDMLKKSLDVLATQCKR